MRFDLENHPTSKLSHNSAALFLSGAIFAIGAQYEHIIVEDIRLALILTGVAAVQWLVALWQSDTRQWLANTSHRFGEMPDFQWSRGRNIAIGIGILWMALTFWVAWSDNINFWLLLLWIGGGVYWWMVLSESGERRISLPHLTIPVNRETLCFIGVLAIGAFFLFYRLNSAPAGMIADHVEKIIDLTKMEQGYSPIYFGANSGREPFHFYAAFALVDRFGFSYLTLKIVSALTAMLVLPGLYWLGKTIDGRLTGLLAMALGAVSVWQMINGRSGFRAGSASLAATIFLAAFWQALRSGKRRDYLLAGILFGLGQYTYTAFRIMPLVVIAGFLLMWMQTAREDRKRLVLNFAALIAIAAMMYTPLFSYWIHYPHVYWFRTQSLIGDNVNNLSALLDGLYQSLALFTFTTDPVGINVIPNRPALGPVAGALLLLGLVLWVWRVYLNRTWMEALLPVIFFIFILPSALGFSSPNEMPSARRSVVAFPVVIVIGAIALSFILRGLYNLRPLILNRNIAIIVGALILYTHARLNWDAYFDKFTPLNNSRSAAQIIVSDQIRAFVRQGGDPHNAFILFEPDYVWVDPRMVAIWLDQPFRLEDNVITNYNPNTCPLSAPPDARFMIALSINQVPTLEKLRDCFSEHEIFTYYGDEKLGGEFRVFYAPGYQDN
jgi:hypothetical protein